MYLGVFVNQTPCMRVLVGWVPCVTVVAHLGTTLVRIWHLVVLLNLIKDVIAWYEYDYCAMYTPLHVIGTHLLGFSTSCRIKKGVMVSHEYDFKIIKERAIKRNSYTRGSVQIFEATTTH